jgi:hypothetical protein
VEKEKRKPSQPVRAFPQDQVTERLHDDENVSSMRLATAWSNRDLNPKEIDHEKSFSCNYYDDDFAAGAGAISNSNHR